uniref:Uncharacterized protein n=1 Tax=Bicosoecida sp. CB-2014 TaxID=1486930 RepID=A0A7S1CH73_9STRA
MAKALQAEAEGRALSAEAQARAAMEERDAYRARTDEARARAEELEKQLAEVQDQLSSANERAREAEAERTACVSELDDVKGRAEDCEAGGLDPRTAETRDMPEAVRKLYEREKARQRRIQHSDADSADNGPKEISMFCPKDMQIAIADLNDDERDNNECMVLNLNGPGVSSRLVLFCDGTHSDFDPHEEDEDHFDDSDE